MRVPIHVRLPSELLVATDEHAERLGCTRTALIERALGDLLEQPAVVRRLRVALSSALGYLADDDGVEARQVCAYGSAALNGEAP
jgi:hypothetical protein